MIEDADADAALLVGELRRGGYELEAQRVDTRAGLEHALDTSWDLILCDYRMPGLDAPTALAVIRGRQIDTPCIIVSDTMGESMPRPPCDWALRISSARTRWHDSFRPSSVSFATPRGA
jgi:CheY-like chemotaxis protein